MSEFPTHPVPANFKDAHIDAERYKAMYQRSIDDPEGFFSEMANEFAAVLPDSKILKQLEELDLSMGTMTAEGARHLLDRADAFRHLKSLNLEENFIPDEVCAALKEAFPETKIVDDNQEEPEDYGDGDVYLYVSVAE